jgi:hypothetical protein
LGRSSLSSRDGQVSVAFLEVAGAQVIVRACGTPPVSLSFKINFPSELLSSLNQQA